MLSTTLSPLVEKLSTLLSAHSDHPVLVALDGRCGSGKTTLAAQLAQQFPQSITVHTDDFYLPPASRVANWEQIPCANMDLERLRAQVLTPARAGQAVPYRAYSCRAGAYLPEQCFAPQPLVIVEGSYSCHPTLADCYDLKVFVTCSRGRAGPPSAGAGGRALFQLHRPVDSAGRGVFRKIPDRADR